MTLDLAVNSSYSAPEECHKKHLHNGKENSYPSFGPVYVQETVNNAAPHSNYEGRSVTSRETRSLGLHTPLIYLYSEVAEG